MDLFSVEPADFSILHEFNLKYPVQWLSTINSSKPIFEKQLCFFLYHSEPETPPENVTFNNVTATTVHLSWSPPEKPNGIIIYYEVMYVNYTDSFVLNSTATNTYLENLKTFSPYNISVKAYTNYGHGNQTSLTVFLWTEQGGKNCSLLLRWH